MIEGLVLALDISHSYPGDLVVRLGYDEDGDGNAELAVPVEIYRARTGDCDAPELFAYPDVLDGVYFFRDEADGGPPDPVAGPDVPSFSGFDRLRKGGSFCLTVIDTLIQETGVVRGWRVYLASRARRYAAP